MLYFRMIMFSILFSAVRCIFSCLDSAQSKKLAWFSGEAGKTGLINQRRCIIDMRSAREKLFGIRGQSGPTKINYRLTAKRQVEQLTPQRRQVNVPIMRKRVRMFCFFIILLDPQRSVSIGEPGEDDLATMCVSQLSSGESSFLSSCIRGNYTRRFFLVDEKGRRLVVLLNRKFAKSCSLKVLLRASFSLSRMNDRSIN